MPQSSVVDQHLEHLSCVEAFLACCFAPQVLLVVTRSFDGSYQEASNFHALQDGVIEACETNHVERWAFLGSAVADQFVSTAFGWGTTGLKHDHFRAWPIKLRLGFFRKHSNMFRRYLPVYFTSQLTATYFERGSSVFGPAIEPSFAAAVGITGAQADPCDLVSTTAIAS